MFENVIQIMVTPPKNQITTNEDEFLRIYVSLNNIYTFQNEQLNLNDHFSDEKDYTEEEKINAVKLLEQSVRKSIDETVKALRLYEIE